MKYQKYPEYKESGIEWLGEVPKHWEIKPIKSLFSRTKRTGYKNETLLSVYREYGVIVKSSRDDNRNKESDDLSPYQLVNIGDLVINKMKAWQGSLAISEHRGIVSPAYYIYEPLNSNNLLNNNFIHNQIRSKYFIQSYKNFSKGIRVGQWDLESELFTRLNLFLPPFDEQRKISEFIQREITKIDNLISKQEQLIKLLEEQRKSIISHAVTKGLNPDAPMKDSGVEWLNEVPEHWDLKRLDSAAKIIRGNSSFSKDDLLENGEYVALQYGKTYKVDEIDENFSFYVNHEFYKETQVAQSGDVILVSTSETIEDLGHSCLYTRNEIGLIGGEQFLLKPNREIVVGKYLYYATKAFSKSLQIYATGTKVFRFNSQILKTVYIPSISLSEQQKIINYLDDRCSKIDLLVSKQKKLIEKLKEYRTSLISHAVTGKIDVREAL